MPIREGKLGWRYFVGKHFEYIYTRWDQGLWLPQKFGHDKRRVHTSSLISSGEIRREDALEELKDPTYAPVLQEEDIAYVLKKFSLSEEELEQIMKLPKKSLCDYLSYARLGQNRVYRALWTVYRALKMAIYLRQYMPA